MDTRQTVSDLRYALSDTEVGAYHRDGIIGPFTLMSPEEMEEERFIIDREIVAPAGNDDDPDMHFHDRHLDHESVCRICRRPELVERVSSLLGPDVLIWRSNFQVKKPAAVAVGDAKKYTRVPWHQDGAYYDLQPHVLVSAWIAITESTEENGCLKVVAGSHLQTFDHDIDPENTSSNARFRKTRSTTTRYARWPCVPGNSDCSMRTPCNPRVPIKRRNRVPALRHTSACHSSA